MARIVTVLIMLLGLTACASLTRVADPANWFPENSLRELTISSTPDANDSYAVRVNILFVFDEDSMQSWPKDAGDWFANKTMFLVQAGPEAEIVELLVPPGKREFPVEMPSKHRQAQRILLYANYSSMSGRKPIELGELTTARLVLDRSEVRSR